MQLVLDFDDDVYDEFTERMCPACFVVDSADGFELCERCNSWDHDPEHGCYDGEDDKWLCLACGHIDDEAEFNNPVWNPDGTN